MPTSNIDCFDMPLVNLLLGSGNDHFMVDTSTAILPSTKIDIEGNGGDDFIEAESVSTTAATVVDGGAGQNTLKVDIAGIPTDGEFTKVQMNVQTLIVDDSTNTTTPIAWTLTDTDLTAETITPAGPSVSVISTEGARTTEIIGSKTNQDTLGVVSTSGPNVQATVSGNVITVFTGLNVVTATNFATFRNYNQVMNFDGLTNGSSTYFSNGFELSTSNTAKGFELSNFESTAAEASADGDLFTLQTVNSSDVANGDGFTMYSIEIADTDPVGSADGSIEFEGTSVTGKPIDFTLTGIKAGVGFQEYSLPTFFTGIESMTFKPTTKMLVDNIVAIDNLPNVKSNATPAAIPVFTVTSALTISTGTNSTGSGFSISGAINENGTAIDLSKVTIGGAAGNGIRATVS